MAASVQARVLIVARDDAMAGPLSEGLDRLGWRTVTARGPYAAVAALSDLAVEAVIIDLKSGGHEALMLGRRLRAACQDAFIGSVLPPFPRAERHYG